MKKSRVLTVIIALALSVLALTACGKSEFSGDWSGDNKMVITAENAGKGDFFASGTLHADEGKEVVVSGNLTKGSVRVELIAVPAEQSIDEVPELDGDPLLKVDIAKNEGSRATLPAGDYMVRATSLEKATGTVQIEVQ